MAEETDQQRIRREQKEAVARRNAKAKAERKAQNSFDKDDEDLANAARRAREARARVQREDTLVPVERADDGTGLIHKLKKKSARALADQDE